MKTRDNFKHTWPVRQRQAFLRSFIRCWALGVGRWTFASSVRPQSTAYSLQPTAGGLRAAFTLIEVLVAMTVLAIMILMVANIFQSSSASWNIGTQKADMNTAARAALDFMARELESAVAGPVDKSVSWGATNLTFQQHSISELRFLSLANDPDPNNRKRAVRGVFFWCDLGENRIMMEWMDATIAPTSPPLNCYSGTIPLWDSVRGGGSILITNALHLYFYVYTNESDLANGTPVLAPSPSSPLLLYQLPLCVDIAIEMLSDDDTRRYGDLKTRGVDTTDFESRNAKIYSTRVYLSNKAGYQAR
jgi:prepilin-type N-terminal cleavage/methylation domain-containing protein